MYKRQTLTLVLHHEHKYILNSILVITDAALIMAHDAVKSHICLKCGKGFASNGDLTQHIRREDNINLLTCEVCGATALDKTRMRDHMDRHEGLKTYVAKHFAIEQG